MDCIVCKQLLKLNDEIIHVYKWQKGLFGGLGSTSRAWPANYAHISCITGPVVER